MISIQVQSVVYNNDAESLLRAVRSVVNAEKVYRGNGEELYVKYVLGDAGEKNSLTRDQEKRIKEECDSQFHFEYLLFGENTGSAKGHNLMEKTANDCEYILVKNPDVMLCPNFFQVMLRPFSNADVGIVEARQIPMEHPKEYNVKTLETPWATTACALISKKVYDEVNGFDADTFFLYCDDVDFSWRVRMNGYKIVYQANCPVYHSKRLDSDGLLRPSEAEIYYSAEAALFMAYKWNNRSLLNNLLLSYRMDAEPCRKAIREFEKRKAEGKLPQKMPQNSIADFSDHGYSKVRWNY